MFDHLVELQQDGRPLVRKVTQIPSRLNRFHAQYRMLDESQQAVLNSWVTQPGAFEDTAYSRLDDGRKTAVVDALVDYVEYRRVRDPADPFAATARRALLLERLKLPQRRIAASSVAGDRQPVPPHLGPRPNMVRVGVVSNDRLGEGVSINLRPAYFDRLAMDAGRIPHATLSMFDVELLRFGQALRLHRLDIVNLEHMNLSETPLPGDGGSAWRVRFGLQDHDLSCAGCLVGKASGGIGKAARVAGLGLAFVMVSGDVQTPHAGSGTVGAEAIIGVVATPLPDWKTSLELGRHSFLNGERAKVWTTKWQNRLGGDRDWDVRLNYERNVASQWQLAFSAYW
ncbi:MAG: hypothetical protein A3J87_05870 [Sideroxydans sp. RIFOXYB12_FULL_59_6]|nr:MAG: hypothetical protein A3J87_05870 [Sideroxydans sp. RIFOXYB12_FULL_59_6]